MPPRARVRGTRGGATVPLQRDVYHGRMYGQIIVETYAYATYTCLAGRARRQRRGPTPRRAAAYYTRYIEVGVYARGAVKGLATGRRCEGGGGHGDSAAVHAAAGRARLRSEINITARQTHARPRIRVFRALLRHARAAPRAAVGRGGGGAGAQSISSAPRAPTVARQAPRSGKIDRHRRRENRGGRSARANGDNWRVPGRGVKFRPLSTAAAYTADCDRRDRRARNRSSRRHGHNILSSTRPRARPECTCVCVYLCVSVRTFV